ncbi:MAG: hypothetical protein WD598_06465 [Acidimicrobiia bacterium]
MSPVAFDFVPWLGGLCALLVAALALVVIAPWRGRDDAALDPEIEARLLLGEDPEEIQRDLDGGTPTAPVADLPIDE